MILTEFPAMIRNHGTLIERNVIKGAVTMIGSGLLLLDQEEYAEGFSDFMLR